MTQPFAQCRGKDCNKIQGALVGYTGAKRRACAYCGSRLLFFAAPAFGQKIQYG